MGLSSLESLVERNRDGVLLLARILLAAGAEHYQAQYINFMKNIAIMGGYLALFVAGPGTISLDGWRRARS